MVDGTQGKKIWNFPIHRGANQEPSRLFWMFLPGTPSAGAHTQVMVGVFTAWKLARLQIMVFFPGKLWSFKVFTSTPRLDLTLLCRQPDEIPTHHDDIIIFTLYGIICTPHIICGPGRLVIHWAKDKIWRLKACHLSSSVASLSPSFRYWICKWRK